MADDRDQDRLRKARAFDRSTLVAIYDEYHEPLYRYVYRQIDDMETSSDLVSEVFRRLLQALRQGGGPERDLKAWLYRTAHNAVVDHYRRRHIRQELPLEEQLTADGDDPALMAEEHLAAERVRRAMHQLTAEQQQVITLKFLAGLSNQEVAAVMGKPVGAVKSLQHRALAALRRQLIPAEEKVP
jgi:RNA polymerase sigma-70 factor (ECF subfamily)